MSDDDDERSPTALRAEASRNLALETVDAMRIRYADRGINLDVPYLLPDTPTHHRHRSTDQTTSVDAARVGRIRWTTTKRQVLAALYAAGERGLLDHDHVNINGIQQDTAGKRRGEMMADGWDLVEDSGRTRETPRGSQAIVWRITAAGIAAHESLSADSAA